MRIAFLIVCAYMATVVSAKSQDVDANSAPPTYDDKGIPTFRSDNGMTELETMIARYGTGCLTQWNMYGKVYYYQSVCVIVEKLRAALSKSSESKSLIDVLRSNDFRCQTVSDETRCRDEFRTIERPILEGQRILSDIDHTFITEVAFKQSKPQPLSADDINVKFTHFGKPYPNR